MLDGSTYRLWYYAVDSTNHAAACYATSADGLTFAKPNLGVVTYGGNTNNNIIATYAVDSVIYDPTLAKWVMLAEDIGAGGTINILTADLPQGPYTLVNNFSPTYYVEGKEIVRTLDGRWIVYFTSGHASQRRSISAYCSQTTDLAGNWSLSPNLFAATTANAQFYAIGVDKRGDLYYGLVMVYNQSDETIRGDLYVSRDGLAWTLAKANWLPLGSSGAWDDSNIICGNSFVEASTAWHLYYTGSPEGHDHGNADSRIGRATIGKGRVGQISGTGEITSTKVKPTAGMTLALNANAVGGSVKIELQDTNGVPLPGFALADFDTITTASFAHAPRWGGVAMPTGQTIRLRIVTVTATVYGYAIA